MIILRCNFRGNLRVSFEFVVSSLTLLSAPIHFFQTAAALPPASYPSIRALLNNKYCGQGAELGSFVYSSIQNPALNSRLHIHKKTRRQVFPTCGRPTINNDLCYLGGKMNMGSDTADPPACCGRCLNKIRMRENMHVVVCASILTLMAVDKEACEHFKEDSEERQGTYHGHNVTSNQAQLRIQQLKFAP